MYFDMYNSLFYAYFYPIFLDFQKSKNPENTAFIGIFRVLMGSVDKKDTRLPK